MRQARSLLATAAMYEPATLALAAEDFSRNLADARPADIVAAAVQRLGHGRVAAVSSFGTESAALLKIVADVDRSMPVLFVDTGWMFEETLAYRDTVVAYLGLTDVRTIRPASAALRRDGGRDLWHRDPDACCALRKIAPLRRSLEDFDGWISGRKRYHGAARATLSPVEADGLRLKFNPLAQATRDEIDAMFRTAGLPRHPLEARGFASVGCMPCTSRAEPGETLRAGRWRGRDKTECGIHLAGESVVTPDDHIVP